MSQEKKQKAYFCLVNNEYLAPYLEQECSKYDIVYDIAGERAYVAVMLSSTDIYDVSEGMNYDENTPIKENSIFAKKEKEFRQLCADKGMKPTILRCANVIGTGMNGFAMRLARGIARGTLFNIKENEAVLSVVHALDVARVALLLADRGETYNVSNGIDTTVVDLIDALSHRVKNKQVFKLGAKWARLLYGNDYYGQMTTSLTFNNIRMVHALPDDMQFVDVVEYLKNHDYTNDKI
jgi:nucleoside-diphosphate-sugar epimerase